MTPAKPALPLTAVQFFEHPVVDFPIDRDNDDFEAFVAKKLQDYIDLIRNMVPQDKITQAIKDDVDKIEGLCNFIKEAITQYLRGLPHKAYAQLHEGISSVFKEFSHRIQPIVEHSFLSQLFRMRKESPDQQGATFTKEELFHVPFEKRHKVTRQRYSIPGLPCLYLGGSVYICWEELVLQR